jgi:NAD(P)H-dependent flavin oxidoreductase YrpB (nitropropane dioxygenase family)
MGEHTMYQALVQGDIEKGELPCGQNAGMVTGLTSAAELIEELIDGLPSVTEALQSEFPSR